MGCRLFCCLGDGVMSKKTEVKASGGDGVKRGRGQPTGYRPEYGGEMIALMSQGFSLTASAAKIGFTKQTIHNWMAAHPEFLDAMNQARGLRQYFLEDKLLSTQNGAAVNACKYALACAFPDDWRERKEIDVNVSGSLAERLEAAKAAIEAE